MVEPSGGNEAQLQRMRLCWNSVQHHEDTRDVLKISIGPKIPIRHTAIDFFETLSLSARGASSNRSACLAMTYLPIDQKGKNCRVDDVEQ